MSVSSRRRRQVMSRMVAAFALALTLTACDGGGDPVEQALRETAAANQAALVKDGAVSAPQASSASASGAEDAAHVQRMIRQNEAALADAQAALASSDPEVRRLAEQAIDTRTAELAELRAWQAGR